MHRQILSQFYLRLSRELCVLILGHMATYPNALPDCPAGTVLLTMHAILLPSMTMHLLFLACYLVISGPWNVFGVVPEMARIDMERIRRRESVWCALNSSRCFIAVNPRLSAVLHSPDVPCTTKTSDAILSQLFCYLFKNRGNKC
uniref:Putative secreted protein n=1 Tax=Ixodes ricinus TaxID=34613 RepID=A0A6B0UUB8_IXORI